MEPGAATCNHDAHGVGNSTLERHTRPRDLSQASWTPQGSGYNTGGTATPWINLATLEELLQATVEPSCPPRSVTGQRDPQESEEKLLQATVGPSYPPRGVTGQRDPQESKEMFLQATVGPSYPPGGVTGQRDPPGKEGKEEEPLHPSRGTCGAVIPTQGGFYKPA